MEWKSIDVDIHVLLTKQDFFLECIFFVLATGMKPSVAVASVREA